jgi:hypothetical protein
LAQRGRMRRLVLKHLYQAYVTGFLKYVFWVCIRPSCISVCKVLEYLLKRLLIHLEHCAMSFWLSMCNTLPRARVRGPEKLWVFQVWQHIQCFQTHLVRFSPFPNPKPLFWRSSLREISRYPENNYLPPKVHQNKLVGVP